jgi:hypothetical protein
MTSFSLVQELFIFARGSWFSPRSASKFISPNIFFVNTGLALCCTITKSQIPPYSDGREFVLYCAVIVWQFTLADGLISLLGAVTLEEFGLSVSGRIIEVLISRSQNKEGEAKV